MYNPLDAVSYVISTVGAPFAQALVNRATLDFTEANITNISEEGFDIGLKGSLLKTGPFDALITFIEPVTVNWQGQDIAIITLPEVTVVGLTGVPTYVTSGRLTVTNLDEFTKFTEYIMHNPSFEWKISTPKLRLTALGAIFDDVILAKTISLNVFNGFPGVAIRSFKLPNDDPAGGIHMKIDAVVPSNSQVGIDLGTVTFESSFQGVELGALSGADFVLAGNSQSPLCLGGRVTPKSGSDLDKIGVLISKYLQSKDQTLIVTGVSVQPPGTSVAISWLNTAFKTLKLQVKFPGQRLNLIDSISLHHFGLKVNESEDSYAPLTFSDQVCAVYRNPFGFSLQVMQSSQHIILTDRIRGFAMLKLPMAQITTSISTGNPVNLVTSFGDQPLKSTNNTAFGNFFKKIVTSESATFGLTGTVDVVARTPIGDISITEIPFSVTTRLAGFNSFGGIANLSEVTISGSSGTGGNEYVTVPLKFAIQNPSNVNLETVGIALPVHYKEVQIGRAIIDSLRLTPGENSMVAEFRYQPNDANDATAQEFLSKFLQSAEDIPLTIKGDSESTPFDSLKPALGAIKLTTSATGAGGNPLVTQINVYISLDSLRTSLVTIDFDINNPLHTDLHVTFAQSDGDVEGETYAHFEQIFESLVIPAHGTVNSGKILNVALVKGVVASMSILSLGTLDLHITATARIGGPYGYEIPSLQLYQPGTPTHYEYSYVVGMAMSRLGYITTP